MKKFFWRMFYMFFKMYQGAVHKRHRMKPNNFWRNVGFFSKRQTIEPSTKPSEYSQYNMYGVEVTRFSLRQCRLWTAPFSFQPKKTCQKCFFLSTIEWFSWKCTENDPLRIRRKDSRMKWIEEHTIDSCFLEDKFLLSTFIETNVWWIIKQAYHYLV
jgi:hypothetical protein